MTLRKAKEIYRDVKGYEGTYEVGNFGNVRSLAKNKILKQGLAGNGYYTVSLRGKTHYIHRLIAEHFIPNYRNGREINHINGIKTDNKIFNLEWVSRSENNKHAYKIGLKKPNVPKGEDCATSKLKNSEVAIIKKELAQGVICRLLAERFGVDRTTIQLIKNGKYWKHITI